MTPIKWVLTATIGGGLTGLGFGLYQHWPDCIKVSIVVTVGAAFFIAFIGSDLD